jgi:hypothetical protein
MTQTLAIDPSTGSALLAGSEYLNRPLRTEAQARAESHKSVIDCDDTEAAVAGNAYLERVSRIVQDAAHLIENAFTCSDRCRSPEIVRHLLGLTFAVAAKHGEVEEFLSEAGVRVHVQCPECHGNGQVDVSRDYNGYQASDCWKCRGQGRTEKP